MDDERVFVKPQKIFVGKTAWVIGAFFVIILIGTVVQMGMTWNRERMRGITSDATDAMSAVQSGARVLDLKATVVDPVKNMFVTPVQETAPLEQNGN